MDPRFHTLLSGLCLCVAFGMPAAADPFPGPVAAQVLRVLDGDTFVAEALVWPGHSVRVAVRIRGIDAPEMRSRCAAEKAAAREARAALAGLLGDVGQHAPVIFRAADIAHRHAAVADAEGRAVGPALLRLGLARPYDGGRRDAFC